MALPSLKKLARRVALGLGAILAVLFLLLVARCLYVFRDRHPGYTLNLDTSRKDRGAVTGVLRAGFGRVTINPALGDPRRPVWVAGFDQHRAATAIHDDLWAVACVLDDGVTRLGVVALDAIGLFHDDVLEVRARAADLGLDYVMVCTTHNHSTPDLMGLWGPDFLHTGVDPQYRAQVIAASAQALRQASGALTSVDLRLLELVVPTEGLVTDTRPPTVYDPDLRAMHFVNATNGLTVGTLIGWANHPETVWGHNTELTADFCGYLRDELERGVRDGSRVLAAGVGGTHLFLNGAIGGLITTSPSVTVRDPYLQQDFKEPSHDKARAVGRQLVARLLPRLQTPDAPVQVQPSLTIRARTIEVPLDNLGFLLAPVLGLIDRGHVRWKTLRTEVALVTLGNASLACIPGEIYPELVNGGVEQAPGGDFDCAPVEVPPLRELMPGQVKFVVGLANDEIGYIIPKSEWDRRPPYLYRARHPLYGEVNSVGPEAAGRVHAVLREFRAGQGAK